MESRPECAIPVSRARRGPGTLPSVEPVNFELDSAELAATYDATSLHQFNHGKQLVAGLAIGPGQRVLDVGCGTGRLGAYVADLVAPDGEVIGIDPLPLRVELAARKHPRLRARVGRAEDLGAFADASFDAVYANSVFHWVEDQPAALSEAMRVLKPRGRLAVNSADAARPHQSAVLFSEAMIEAGIAGAASVNTYGPPHRVDALQLRSLLERAGFIDIQIQAHTAVDEMADVDAFIDWMKSSTFGNFLLDVAVDERPRARAVLERRLEPLRTTRGLRLERYLVFAIARRG